MTREERYRREHPGHYGDNFPFVSEAHAPSRWRRWGRDVTVGAICGAGLFLLGAGIVAIGRTAGWW